MKTMRVEMSRQASTFEPGDKLFVPMVYWPKRCPCCGSVIDGQVQYQLTHRPILGVAPGGGLETAVLSWRIPICGRCRVHFVSTVAIKVALGITPPLLWVGSAWLLFLAGFEEDWFVIALWIVEGIMLVGMAVFAWRWSTGIARDILHRQGCWGADFPIRVTSRYPVLEFELSNDVYADEVIALNT